MTYHMLKRVLSTSALTSGPAAARAVCSSETVSPRRARFWVVTKMGIWRAVAAARSLRLVRILFSNPPPAVLVLWCLRERDGDGDGDLHLVVLVDGGAELLLDVADAGGAVLTARGWTRVGGVWHAPLAYKTAGFSAMASC